ncbi:hypothetical protein FAZ15_00575 [Sphingobacterium olei]|uniref:Uncharacterized protein n=1 Tax=Sphingobacterium olei TaxID=2571155 RepID=A0A4U0P690_9SPHI|nr:hypothetical protein [Sphingobacterium olei]TJZ62839.1 hypothetical protein FAZ15_00575 [Sphingobacterium olei]
MKKIYLILIAFPLLFQACSKDDPTPEVDQEEVSGLTLTFTEVEGEAHDDHYDYSEITDPEVESISFSGTNLLPPEGAHMHLEVGKSYRFNIKMLDFAGRETQQTFIDRDDIHFAFILGAPAESLHVQYADVKTDGTKAKVGVQGYFTVLKASSSFTANYIMRHLNPGVKTNIDTKTDWSNTDYKKFTGANDIDVKFELHFVEGHDHDNH